MTKNTIMPIERAFDEYLEYCEFTRRMSCQTLSAKRWVMRDFRTSVPARSLSEITTQQVNDWIENPPHRQTKRDRASPPRFLHEGANRAGVELLQSDTVATD